MNRLRNLISGTSDHDDGDCPPAGQSGRRNDAPSSSSWNSKFGYSNNKSSSRYHTGGDDLYLSDDDEWGMSTFSSQQHTLREADRYGAGGARRSSSSAFWDQSSLDDGSESDGGGVGGARVLEMQQWEREAITRDDGGGGGGGAFEIGDDDFYHSEQRQPQRGGSKPPPPWSGKDNNAYAEVQEDIRSLENDDDDTSSTSSSTKEEVVNAYRDYLKSIRDGGFESYLDTDAGGGEPDFEDVPTGGGGGGDDGHDDEDAALERVLDVEEERSSGSMYGDMYGVRDVRSSNEDPYGAPRADMGAGSGESPYSAWRAKAKALLQQEQEREDATSPSRQILNRFRRERSNGGAGGSPQKRGRDVNADGDRGNGEGWYGASEKLYSYRCSLLQSPKFRWACIAACLILALAAGLSYYGGKSSVANAEEREETVPYIAIPPKDSPSGNNNNGGQTYSQNLHSGPSDAILNSLQTFDPIWYNRRSGWEGITFMDAVNFCLSHERRVPCPYEIYCNQGMDGSPYRGDRLNGEQWSPVSNGANQWVQVGGMFTCKRYTDLHGHKKPDWGITGISLEHDHGAGGITQNVMCCVDLYNIGGLDPFTEWGRQEEIEQVEGDASQKTTNTALVNVQDSENEKNPNAGNVAASSHNDDLDAQKREKVVISAFQPIWFSSAHGWSGTSYEDAILFCESYNHMVLCPYAAYCPNGNARGALPGSMVTELDGEEWAPANGPMNTWLQIGTIDGDESTRCTLHHELLGERPQWGVDGTKKEVKHHIMCCLM